MSKIRRMIICCICIAVCLFANHNIFIESNAGANSVPTIKFDNSGKVTGTITKLDSKKTTLNKILSEYRGVITFLSAIGSLSMIMFFIMNFIALGNSKGNPQARQKAINGLIISGIATAGLGSVTVITGLFYNMLKLD